ncbi:tachykinin-like peptides receptor 86C [Asterias amurensis]|uniref:tachykinin-like peptides receptor 86C n=1 Tax=Asterias amurensis TaxID=7602 RepID=UPI003AB483DF
MENNTTLANYTGDEWTEDNTPSDSKDVWIYALEITFGVVGTVGNSLVCLIIIRAKFLHNMTNYLILSLAVADFAASLSLIFNVFFVDDGITSAPKRAYRAGGELYCRLYGNLFFFWVCVTASVFNLIVVTLERFFAIVFPLHYNHYFTNRRIVILVVLTWVLAVLQEFFALLINSYDAEKEVCAYGFPNIATQVAIGLFIFLTSYFLPLVVMIWAYYKIMRNLQQSARTLLNQQTEDPAYALLRARKKVVQVLFTVVMAFLVLWTPNQVVYLFENLTFPILETDHILYALFRLMAFSNSVVNPFIYGFKYKQFRKGFRVVVCGKCMVNNVGGSHELSTT